MQQWGYMKTIVDATKPSSLKIKAKIINVFLAITLNQLAHVFSELQNRINFCVASDGEHVES